MQPTIYVILGITGDLAQKKILPALYSLYVKGELPKKCAIVGFSRRPWSDDAIRKFVAHYIPKSTKAKRFLSLISYVQGDFSDGDTYDTLAKHLAEIDGTWKTCSNKLFYLSVPPTLYETIFKHISASGLSIPCGGDQGWARILVEKPFGSNMASSKKLNRLVEKLFDPSQVFRIDHYMAKTSLRNIEVFRQSHISFAKKWNTQGIEFVSIQLLEKNIPKDRGAFYDAVGALNDVGQNHILQMLALVAMPIHMKTSIPDARHDRATLFNSLTVSREGAVRGQYAGFRSHMGVSKNSQTESFFALTVSPTDGPLAGVPIRIESGKGLSEDTTEVAVRFKDNVEITFSSPKSESAEAYEKVLLDCMSGDQTVFTSGEEVEAEWRFTAKARKVLNGTKLKMYKVGSGEGKISNYSN